jgi:hypothetical protein
MRKEKRKKQKTKQKEQKKRRKKKATAGDVETRRRAGAAVRGGDERGRGWPEERDARRAKLGIKVKTGAPKAKGVEPCCDADGR